MTKLEKHLDALTKSTKDRENIPFATRQFMSSASNAIRDNRIISLQQYDENIQRKKQEFLKGRENSSITMR